jgi:hypothetical protein
MVLFLMTAALLVKRYDDGTVINAADDREGLPVEVLSLNAISSIFRLMDAGGRGSAASLDVRLRNRSLPHAQGRMDRQNELSGLQSIENRYGFNPHCSINLVNDIVKSWLSSLSNCRGFELIDKLLQSGRRPLEQAISRDSRLALARELPRVYHRLEPLWSTTPPRASARELPRVYYRLEPLRLSVALILECLANGMTLDDIDESFDRTFPREALSEVLKVASELAGAVHVAA